MSEIYATRSQVGRYARRQGITSFMSVRVPNRGWKLFEMHGDVSAALEYAKGKDFVAQVECHHIDEGRQPGTRPVLVVTCLRDELPADIPFDVEPVTPSLWEQGAADNFDHRARSKASAGQRAKSDVESPTKLVWKIADEMVDAPKKDVVAACVAAGVNASTASTQYYRWSKVRESK